MPVATGLASPGLPAGTTPRAWPHAARRPDVGTVPVAEVGFRGAVVHGAALLSGLALATAWLLPETKAAAALGWVAAALFAFALRARRAYLPAYACGVVGHLVGFYWVRGTVAFYGGFGQFGAALIFGLFVALGALQFALIAFVHHRLGPRFDALALRVPTAVVLSELVAFRLFRWHFGHTQVAFTPFVQVAGVGGAMAVSFLLFWVAEAAVRAVVFRERRAALWLPALALGLALAYGAAMIRTFDAPRGQSESQEVVLVQGNAQLAEKRDLASAQKNLARLYDLSRRHARPGTLIVWPEGSIPAYLPADMGSVREKPLLPWLGDGSAFLIGAYAYRGDRSRYNAAFAVYPDGDVPPPYFKQALIPFGESMPLATYFPRLRRLNPRAGVFAAGAGPRVFRYPLRRADGTASTLSVSPLICYEDTLPALARAATRRGAELLVNLTSDSWFGRSPALHQHHLIAAFRAIENRRYLVRATNTGVSAVVDPLGRTVARIPEYAEGTATVRVEPLKYQSIYANLVGETPWWLLLTVSLADILMGRRREGRRFPFGGLRPAILPRRSTPPSRRGLTPP